jgi:hypothetical protein
MHICLITRLRIPVLLLAILVTAAFALAACGDDDGDGPGPAQQPTPTTAPEDGNGSESDPDDDEDEAGDDDPRQLPGSLVGGSGTITVDGQSFPISDIIRCVPFRDDSDDLDLTALGSGIQAFVYITPERSQELDIQGSALDGAIYSGSVFSFDGGSTWLDDFDEQVDAAPLEWSGERVSGTMTVHDIFEEADPVEVTIDLAVPSRQEDC